jgi:hypothetical protein
MDIKYNAILKDHSGVALVIAMLMVTILTLIGIASTFTSTVEIRLSGNKRGLTDAFYAADGGIQSVLPGIGNFNVSTNFVSVDPKTLPTDLQNESIDKKNSKPSLALPSGLSFVEPPRVTIYHTAQTNSPIGSGFSAINFEYDHFIVDSIGRDQTEMGLVRSNCQIREKIATVVPTLQGGY